MSHKQMRFQVTSKLIRPNSWITQTVRQRIPNCCARNGESTSAESAATDAWNDELTATGGSQMLATRNRGDLHAVIGEVRLRLASYTSFTSERILGVCMCFLDSRSAGAVISWRAEWCDRPVGSRRASALCLWIYSVSITISFFLVCLIIMGIIISDLCWLVWLVFFIEDEENDWKWPSTKTTMNSAVFINGYRTETKNCGRGISDTVSNWILGFPVLLDGRLDTRWISLTE